MNIIACDHLAIFEVDDESWHGQISQSFGRFGCLNLMPDETLPYLECHPTFRRAFCDQMVLQRI